MEKLLITKKEDKGIWGVMELLGEKTWWWLKTTVFVKTIRTIGASQVVPVLKNPPCYAEDSGSPLARELRSHRPQGN